MRLVFARVSQDVLRKLGKVQLKPFVLCSGCLRHVRQSELRADRSKEPLDERRA